MDANEKYILRDLEIIECKRCNKVIVSEENENGMCMKCWEKTENEKTNILEKIVTMLTKKVSKTIKFHKDANSERILLAYNPGGFKGIYRITTRFELEKQNIIANIETSSKTGTFRHLCFRCRFCIANPKVHEEVSDWLITKFYKIELSIRVSDFVPKNLTYKKYMELGGKDRNLKKLAVLAGEEL